METYHFAGADTLQLAKDYHTPLFVISEDILREQASRLKDSLKKAGANYKIYYAGKAFLCTGILPIIEDLELGLDCSSGGELFTALTAGFPAENIIFHGSNKSEEELKEALSAKVGRIVIDSADELERLKNLTEDLDTDVNVYVRVNPGVDAHVNELINTGKTDTKFGIPFEEVEDFIEKMDSDRIHLVGLHSHIGSQIIEETPFLVAAEKVIKLFAKLKQKGYNELKELNLGGGFGISYTPKEAAFVPEESIPKLVERLREIAEENQIELPTLVFEPGRFLIATAGITLYTVGTVKELKDLRTYISVDGGMADNPRPALYGAEYFARICNRELSQQNAKTVRVSGKSCETDTLIEKIDLASPRVGDILAVFNTGAYNYSMASHYNRLPIPAVVLIHQGKADLLIERETYDDLIRQDKIPYWLEK